MAAPGRVRTDHEAASLAPSLPRGATHPAGQTTQPGCGKEERANARLKTETRQPRVRCLLLQLLLRPTAAHQRTMLHPTPRLHLDGACAGAAANTPGAPSQAQGQRRSLWGHEHVTASCTPSPAAASSRGRHTFNSEAGSSAHHAIWPRTRDGAAGRPAERERERETAESPGRPLGRRRSAPPPDAGSGAARGRLPLRGGKARAALHFARLSLLCRDAGRIAAWSAGPAADISWRASAPYAGRPRRRQWRLARAVRHGNRGTRMGPPKPIKSPQEVQRARWGCGRRRLRRFQGPAATRQSRCGACAHYGATGPPE